MERETSTERDQPESGESERGESPEGGGEFASSGIGISEEALHTIASHCVVGGLCPLIPIPFVDDMIITRVHRHMNEAIFEMHGVEPTGFTSRLMTSRPTNFWGAILETLIVWPIKKLVRKIVYVLAIKSCADVAAQLFHEGWLLAHAFEREIVDMDDICRQRPDALRALRHAILDTLERVDPSMTRQLVRSVFDVGTEVFSELLGAARGALVEHAGEGDDARLEAAEEELAPLTARLEEVLREQWSHGPQLDEGLRAALAERAPEGGGGAA